MTTTTEYGPTVALIVVDVQNDFADPGGGLYVQDGEAVVPLINAEVGTARAAGSTVIYTQDWHPETTPHFEKDGGIWPVHCVQDSWGADLHPDLAVEGPSVRKGAGGEDGYSGFTMRDPRTDETKPTQLQSLLPAEVRRLVVVGLAGDYCVKETALDGVRLGYEVAVPLALTRFVNLRSRDDEQAAADLAAAGVDVR